jgi:hypothetical protein
MLDREQALAKDLVKRLSAAGIASKVTDKRHVTSTTTKMKMKMKKTRTDALGRRGDSVEIPRVHFAVPAGAATTLVT